MDLLFLSDISQLNYVVRKKPCFLEELRPVTGDIVVAAELERLGISFFEEWNFIDAADIERNWNLANELSAQWWDESLASTEYEGFPLSDAAKQELVYPFEASLNTRTVYERLFREERIKSISGYFLPEVGVVRTGPSPTFRAVMSVSQAVLFWVAEQHGISVKHLKSSRPLSQGERIKRFSGGDSCLSLQEKTKCDQGHIVLILDHGMPVIERKALQKCFAGKKGWKLITISQSELDAGILSGTNQLAVMQRLTKAWNAFETERINYSGPYPELFANRHLDFQFKRIWAEMARASQIGDLFAAILDTLNPSLVVLGHDAFTIERVQVRLAQQRNIPIVAFFHGGLAFVSGFRGIVGDADYIMVWNDIDHKVLTQFGVDGSRISKVGSIRYENKYDSYKLESVRDSSSAKRRARLKLNLPEQIPLVLLLTAATTTGMAAPIANQPRHRATLQDLGALASKRTDLLFAIKPHPGFDHYEIYRQLSRTGRSNLIFLENANLDDVLEASDICLMVNYCTTAALEAMLEKLPVVYLNTAIYPTAHLTDTLPPGGAIRISSINELETTIDRLLEDDAFRNQALTKAGEALSTIMGENKQSSLEILSLEFDRIVSRREGEHNQKLRMRSPLAQQSAAKIKLFLGYYKFDELIKELGQFAPLLGNLQGSDKLLERDLRGIAFMVGANAQKPADIQQLIKISNLSSSAKLPVLQRQLLFSAYIVAMSKSANAGQCYLSLSFALRALCILPRRMLALPMQFKDIVLKNVLKSVVGQNKLGISMVNFLLSRLYSR